MGKDSLLPRPGWLLPPGVAGSLPPAATGNARLGPGRVAGTESLPGGAAAGAAEAGGIQSERSMTIMFCGGLRSACTGGGQQLSRCARFRGSGGNMIWNRFGASSLAGIAVLSLACLLRGQENAGSAAQSSPSDTHGVQPDWMDKTCKPCQDFYHYANGEWLRKNPIPAAYPSWNSFTELAERNREHLHEILERAAANRNAGPGSNEQKIGDFYASCMDEQQVNKVGVRPLDPELQQIEAIQNASQLQKTVAALQKLGVNAMFRFRSTQDARNSSEVIAGADQGGLGLPDRDYYTKTDEKSQKIRQQYLDHVGKMFQLLDDDSAKSGDEAKTVMAIETKLAEASLNRVERRDPEKLYHKMTRAQLQTLTPDFSWDGYLQNIGYPDIQTIDVAVPKFFESMNADLKSVSIEDWKTYLRWHLVDAAAPALSDPFVNEDFNFRGAVLTGTKELLPRWKRCVQAADRSLGEALGPVYVQRYFPPEAKARALAMVNNLVAALRDDLRTLAWMSEPT